MRILPMAERVWRGTPCLLWVLAACSDIPINWPVPCYPFHGARHDLVNNVTAFYIGSDYQGIHNQQVENEKRQETEEYQDMEDSAG